MTLLPSSPGKSGSGSSSGKSGKSGLGSSKSNYSHNDGWSGVALLGKSSKGGVSKTSKTLVKGSGFRLFYAGLIEHNEEEQGT